MTDLLDRSVDLVHEKVENVHNLYFDSSYPTRIKGNLIKIFKATDDYIYGEPFSLKLEDELIIDIPKENVASFGSKLKDNDYFRENDCVLCVIEVLKDKKGKIKLWNISREYNARSEAMIFEYQCNGVDDTKILSDILSILQSTVNDGAIVSIDKHDIYISSEARKTTRQCIFKIIGKLGLDHDNVWHNFDQTLHFNRQRRAEYLHISSNSLFWDSAEPEYDIYREDVFSYIFDFEECIIIEDAKETIHKLNDKYNITSNTSKWGGRAFLFGLDGNSKCHLTIKNLRFCKDYMGIVFVDGENKSVILENDNIVTNTFGGVISPTIYGSMHIIDVDNNNILGNENFYVLGDSCFIPEQDGGPSIMYEEEISTQNYDKKFPFPILIDNYSDSSKVTLKNSYINPLNEGYSAIPHIIHNSGHLSIDNTIINFYNCVRYYDDNLHNTMSAAIFNEPRLVDLNEYEYKRCIVGEMDYPKIKRLIMPGTVPPKYTPKFFIEEGYFDSSEEAPDYSEDYIGKWALLNMNTNKTIPTIEISNSEINHTKGSFIYNYNGDIKIYNSKLQINNKKYMYDYFGYSEYEDIQNSNQFDGIQKPFISTLKYNRLVDSYAGEVYIKDNTIISNGNNIQIINMSPCLYNNNTKTGHLQMINNNVEIEYDLYYITRPTQFVKSITKDLEEGTHLNNNTRHSIILQNNTFRYKYDNYVYLPSYTEEKYNSNEYQLLFDKLHIYDDTLKRFSLKMGHLTGRHHYFPRKYAEAASKNTSIYKYGTIIIDNIGASDIGIYNCKTDTNNNINYSPTFGIIDTSTDNYGKLTIDNCSLNTWFTSIIDVIEPLLITIDENDYNDIYKAGGSSSARGEEIYPKNIYAHNVYINNSKFFNFFDLSKKDKSQTMVFQVPVMYLECNNKININNCEFNGNDVVINTNNDSSVYVSKSNFYNSKLIFNAFKDRLDSENHEDLFLSRYNLICYRPITNHNRMASDNVHITDCVFENDVNVDVKFDMRDLHTPNNCKTCVNKSNIIINSVKNVYISDNVFKSSGNNIFMYGQQSALQEFYIPYKLLRENSPRPQFGTPEAIPVFGFNITLKNNEFNSIITEIDNYNKKCNESEINDHFIASNVFLFGDTVNLNAYSNTFKIASVDGGANILSLTDRYYYQNFENTTYTKLEMTTNPSLYEIKNIADKLLKYRFDNSKNSINISDNEFLSFVFGVKAENLNEDNIEEIGITAQELQSLLYNQTQQEIFDEIFNTESLRSDPLLKFAPNIYRTFAIGIDNCNTTINIDNNIFSKSRGKNDDQIVDGCITYKQRITDAKMFEDENSNDIYSGYGILFNSTKYALGEDYKYSLTGSITNNTMGIKYTNDENVKLLDDGYMLLDMQGLIFKNTYKEENNYPSIFSTKYRVLITDNEDSAESTNIFGDCYTKYKIDYKGNYYDNPTDYNKFSSAVNYSFDNDTKTIYK